MANNIFSKDQITKKEPIAVPGGRVSGYTKLISAEATKEQLFKGEMFAKEIFDSYVTDFEKTEKMLRQGKTDAVDTMVHVSTFLYLDDMIYMTYYASTQTTAEDPNFIKARFVFCPKNNVENKTFFDIQSVGDECSGGIVELVYDTILMQKDERTLFILWTASINGNYYRLYRTFDTVTKTLSEVGVNRLKVGNTVNDFSRSGIISAFTENELGLKKIYADIGIMQKLSSRVENGETYYYSGAYTGDHSFIIKSKDLITWEYVSQPDFPNYSQYENAVYVYGDKCYYFVRQYVETKHGFLTYYDLNEHTWAKPVLIEDSQSRSDFIVYDDELYMVYAPVDREHIGIIRIGTDNLEDTEIVLQADMRSSCFYPFIQYCDNGELGMSYTVDRKHIRLSRFNFKKYTV